MVPGFELMTFRTWVSSHNYLTRFPAQILINVAKGVFKMGKRDVVIVISIQYLYCKQMFFLIQQYKYNFTYCCKRHIKNG